MGFITLPGLPGKVYVPANRPADSKKHPCPDCFGCQNCSHDRCGLCRSGSLLTPNQSLPESRSHMARACCCPSAGPDVVGG